MTIKEICDEHLKKSAVHHDVFAKSHRALVKANLDAADQHANTNPTLARIYRDIGEHHGNLAKGHERRQKDFDNLREALAEASDATVLDSHSGAGDALREAVHADFLKRAFGIGA